MESTSVTTPTIGESRRILLVIDHFGSGGAQRQLSLLATLLHREGLQVEVLTYYEHSFFLREVQDLGIPVHCLKRSSKISRLLAMRKFIRSHNPCVVIAYLNTPSLICELSGLPSRNFALIVSERNTNVVDRYSWSTRIRLQFHKLSDRVVTNSYSQAEVVRSVAPALDRKIVTIWNCVDLGKFTPPTQSLDYAQIRAVCVGRYSEQKNPTLVVHALKRLACDGLAGSVTVDWYGSPSQGKLGRTAKYVTLNNLRDLVKKERLDDVFRLNSVREDIQNVYRKSHVLVLTSAYEGCPNVVCEAMASGMPIIASRVGDIPKLVHDGKHGYLFDSGDAEGLASCMHKFQQLPASKKIGMGRACRQFAVDHLSPSQFIRDYIQLIEDVSGSDNGSQRFGTRVAS